MNVAFLRTALKRVAWRAGYHVARRAFGQNAYDDIKLLTPSDRPVLFDVGANIGQTIDILRETFTSPIIHAFEPGRAAFAKLQKQYSATPDVKLNNVALGAKPGSQTFYENRLSEMSSFLPLGPDGWGNTISQTEIGVSTVDEYCERQNVSHIDLLKSDTQGFDLEVIKGTQRMIRDRRVRLLYLEITFIRIYEMMPRVDEIYRFISDQGFELVSFYKFEYINGRAGWTDALFIHPGFARD